MKLVYITLASLAMTALALYSLQGSSVSTSMLKQAKGVLYDVTVCGTNNYKLDLVSFTTDKPVKSRSTVHMSFNFKGSEDGQITAMKLVVSKGIPLFSHTYKSEVNYTAGNEAAFVNKFSIPMIPIHATVYMQATLTDASGGDALTICGKLDV